jgi:DNA topoisomerase-1
VEIFNPPKKISEILGDEYIIKATIGHISDLPKDTLGIDVENNFEANYIINPDKLENCFSSFFLIRITR